MKNMKFNILISAFLALAFATSCTKSSAESKDDPALLQYIITQSRNGNSTDLSSPVGLCLSNVAAMNTCVGGAGQGEGFSGNLCATDPATATTLQKLGATTATTCISGKITSTNCNLSENKFIDAAAAESTFSECYK